MRVKFLIFSLLVFIFIPLIQSYSSSFPIAGIKVGINYSKFGNHEGDLGPEGSKYPIYEYPVGFNIGGFREKHLTNKLSLIGELCYERRILKATYYTSCLGIPENKLTIDNISLPVLLKFDLKKKLVPYILIGINLRYVLKANYKSYDHIYETKVNKNIEKSLSRLRTSISAGVGKKVKINNDLYLILEIIGSYGLVKNKYYLLGQWRNCSLKFVTGVQFN